MFDENASADRSNDHASHEDARGSTGRGYTGSRADALRAARAELRDIADILVRAIRLNHLGDMIPHMQDVRELIKSDLLRKEEVSRALTSATEEAGARREHGYRLVAWLMALPNAGEKPVDKHDRPRIDVSADNHPDVVDEAEDALIEAQLGVYRRGNRLVRLGTAIRALPRCDFEESTVVAEVDEHGLCELFNRAALFEAVREGKDNIVYSKPISCPPSVARAYLARKGIGWHLPVLNGILRAPTLRPRGTLLDLPGFDMATGLFLDLGQEEFPQIPRNPTEDNAFLSRCVARAARGRALRRPGPCGF